MNLRMIPLLTALATGSLSGQIDSEMFRHHYIARELPGRNLGMGAPALADFDRDGDLDFAVLNRGDRKLYWFENQGRESWVRHSLGEALIGQLGSAVLDVDGDDWPDIVLGGFWFRNSGSPRREEFSRYPYDPAIEHEIHDIVIADINGDGRRDVVAMGDRDGCFWYDLRRNEQVREEWLRTVITRDVLNDEVDIHAGLSSNGVGDLDGDGDADVMLTDRWMENGDGGRSWVPHRLLYGKKGPWGFSSRSWIIDLDGDGDNDVVVVDSDGQNSATGWIENRDGVMGRYRVHYLANQAPGTRGSFHSLRVSDFDSDGDPDILVVEQEDPSILPRGATPRWYIWENRGSGDFVERVILEKRLGGHDAQVGDVDGDGDPDIVSKIWSVWAGNGNGGNVHIDWLENLTR